MHHIISTDQIHETDNPELLTVGGEIRKIYEYGRKGRPPCVTLTLFLNGTACVENCCTGKTFVADSKGIKEAFALAQRISQNMRNKDYTYGW